MGTTSLTVIADASRLGHSPSPTRGARAEDAYFAANSCDWLGFFTRAQQFTRSVECELREMTTAKGWTKLA